MMASCAVCVASVMSACLLLWSASWMCTEGIHVDHQQRGNPLPGAFHHPQQQAPRLPVRGPARGPLPHRPSTSGKKHGGRVRSTSLSGGPGDHQVHILSAPGPAAPTSMGPAGPTPQRPAPAPSASGPAPRYYSSREQLLPPRAAPPPPPRSKAFQLPGAQTHSANAFARSYPAPIRQSTHTFVERPIPPPQQPNYPPDIGVGLPPKQRGPAVTSRPRNPFSGAPYQQYQSSLNVPYVPVYGKAGAGSSVVPRQSYNSPAEYYQPPDYQYYTDNYDTNLYCNGYYCTDGNNYYSTEVNAVPGDTVPADMNTQYSSRGEEDLAPAKLPPTGEGSPPSRNVKTGKRNENRPAAITNAENFINSDAIEERLSAIYDDSWSNELSEEPVEDLPEEDLPEEYPEKDLKPGKDMEVAAVGSINADAYRVRQENNLVERIDFGSHEHEEVTDLPKVDTSKGGQMSLPSGSKSTYTNSDEVIALSGGVPDVGSGLSDELLEEQLNQVDGGDAGNVQQHHRVLQAMLSAGGRGQHRDQLETTTRKMELPKPVETPPKPIATPPKPVTTPPKPVTIPPKPAASLPKPVITPVKPSQNAAIRSQQMPDLRDASDSKKVESVAGNILSSSPEKPEWKGTSGVGSQGKDVEHLATVSGLASQAPGSSQTSDHESAATHHEATIVVLVVTVAVLLTIILLVTYRLQRHRIRQLMDKFRGGSNRSANGSAGIDNVVYWSGRRRGKGGSYSPEAEERVNISHINTGDIVQAAADAAANYGTTAAEVTPKPPSRKKREQQQSELHM